MAIKNLTIGNVTIKGGKMDYFKVSDDFKATIKDFATFDQLNGAETVVFKAQKDAITEQIAKLEGVRGLVDGVDEKISQLEKDLETLINNTVITSYKFKYTKEMELLHKQYSIYVQAMVQSDSEGVEEYEWYVEKLQAFFANNGMELTTIGLKIINETMGLAKASAKDRALGKRFKAISKSQYFDKLFRVLADNMIRVGAIEFKIPNNK